MRRKQKNADRQNRLMHVKYEAKLKHDEKKANGTTKYGIISVKEKKSWSRDAKHRILAIRHLRR